MSGSGRMLNEIGHPTKRLEEHGFSLEGIKTWRAAEMEAGRACGRHDFYRQNGICPACNCYGLEMTGWDEESQVPLWTICSRCGGSGRVPPW